MWLRPSFQIEIMRLSLTLFSNVILGLWLCVRSKYIPDMKVWKAIVYTEPKLLWALDHFVSNRDLMLELLFLDYKVTFRCLGWGNTELGWLETISFSYYFLCLPQANTRKLCSGSDSICSAPTLVQLFLPLPHIYIKHLIHSLYMVPALCSFTVEIASHVFTA